MLWAATTMGPGLRSARPVLVRWVAALSEVLPGPCQVRLVSDSYSLVAERYRGAVGAHPGTGHSSSSKRDRVGGAEETEKVFQLPARTKRASVAYQPLGY